MDKRILTKEEFVNKAINKHGVKYDYSLVKYERSRFKVEIICKEHGIFIQQANAHLNGRGCRKCGNIIISTKRISNLTKFIEKAKLIHENHYDYSKSVYINSMTEMIIICKIHGEFLQTPSNHFNKHGCQRCGMQNSGWGYSNWVDKSLKSKYFDSYKLYIIRCHNDLENFYKVGKTYRKLSIRFDNKHKMPYKVERIKVIESDDPIKICRLEKELLNLNKEYKYNPQLNFCGKHECFNFNFNYENIEKLIEEI